MSNNEKIILIKGAFSDALLFYQNEFDVALRANKEIRKQKKPSYVDTRLARRMIAESKKRLNFCRLIIDRDGFGDILLRIDTVPMLLTKYQMIRGLIDLYFYSIDPKRIRANKGRIDKISGVRKAVRLLLDEIENDPVMSMYPSKDGCYLRGILNNFYVDVPHMVDSIVPWCDEKEAIAKTSEKYFAMMMVISYRITNARLLADIVNITFDCENWDTSLANKAIRSSKKYNKNNK